MQLTLTKTTNRYIVGWNTRIMIPEPLAPPRCRTGYWEAGLQRLSRGEGRGPDGARVLAVEGEGERWFLPLERVRRVGGVSGHWPTPSYLPHPPIRYGTSCSVVGGASTRQHWHNQTSFLGGRFELPVILTIVIACFCHACFGLTLLPFSHVAVRIRT